MGFLHGTYLALIAENKRNKTICALAYEVRKHGAEISKDFQVLTHIIVDNHLVPPIIIVPREWKPVPPQFGHRDLPQLIRDYGRVDQEGTPKPDRICIVRRTWLDACLKEKRLVDEEPFIIHGVPSQKAGLSPLLAKGVPWLRSSTPKDAVAETSEPASATVLGKRKASFLEEGQGGGEHPAAPPRKITQSGGLPSSAVGTEGWGATLGPRYLADRWGHPCSFAWLPNGLLAGVAIEGISWGELQQRQEKVHRPMSLGGGEWVDFHEASYILVPLPTGDYSSIPSLRQATRSLSHRRSRHVVSWKFVLDCAREEELLDPAEYEVVTSAPAAKNEPHQ